MKRSIKKVLIANRSEVALRIQSTCHDRNLKTVAAFSDQDHYASFVYTAHEAYPINLSGHHAYRAQEELIKIARLAGADAIHPGYGFLSENAEFAQRVIEAGLTWIGPSPSCIRAMGDKIEARLLMEKANVAVVPGFYVYDFSDQSRKDALIQAQKIGFPVIIKDPQGGGGKGMRRVDNEEGFEHAFLAVVSESQKLTGSSSILIEKYIQHGRHIEIQIAGDGQQFIHLFERECSVQRRHQKIMEEAPCRYVDQAILEEMYTAAIQAAAAVQYDSIGTVEFIVTPNGEFYFLEMNTRLQVEHAVTELITGVDLVGLQLDLVQNRQLPFKQQDITRTGHALQCRLYAEDPTQNFLPSTGTLEYVHIPNHPFIRAEHDLIQGFEITPLYDPMIGKFIAFAQNRDLAINRMVAFLKSVIIRGVTTNKEFLVELAQTSEFMSGVIHTQMLSDREFMNRIIQAVQAPQACDENDILSGIATVLFDEHSEKNEYTINATQTTPSSGSNRAWRLQQWR